MKEEQLLKQLTQIVFGGILLYWGLTHFGVIQYIGSFVLGLVFPFLLGGAIAFLLSIPMGGIEKQLAKGLKKEGKALRPISLLLTLIIIGVILVGVTLIVLPEIGNTLLMIGEEIEEFVSSSDQMATDMKKILPELTVFLEELGISWSSITQTATSFVRSVSTAVIDASVSFTTKVFGGVVNFVLALVFAIYVLIGKEWLGEQFTRVLTAYGSKTFVAKTQEVLHLSHRIFVAFFRGQCLEACILGGMFFVGMYIFKFPYVLLVSVLVAFTALIPIFGAFIGCGVGVFLIMMVDPIQAFWFLVFFLVLQQIEGNLIYPRVVGESVGLPAILVLMAVTLGAGLMGVVGMLIFIPLVSVLYTLLQKDVEGRLQEKKKEA